MVSRASQHNASYCSFTTNPAAGPLPDLFQTRDTSKQTTWHYTAFVDYHGDTVQVCYMLRCFNRYNDTLPVFDCWRDVTTPVRKDVGRRPCSGLRCDCDPDRDGVDSRDQPTCRHQVPWSHSPKAATHASCVPGGRIQSEVVGSDYPTGEAVQVDSFRPEVHLVSCVFDMTQAEAHWALFRVRRERGQIPDHLSDCSWVPASWFVNVQRQLREVPISFGGTCERRSKLPAASDDDGQRSVECHWVLGSWFLWAECYRCTIQHLENVD